jgi:hypothetical protein
MNPLQIPPSSILLPKLVVKKPPVPGALAVVSTAKKAHVAILQPDGLWKKMVGADPLSGENILVLDIFA